MDKKKSKRTENSAAGTIQEYSIISNKMWRYSTISTAMKTCWPAV